MNKTHLVLAAVILATLALPSLATALDLYRNNCAHPVIGDINDDGRVSLADLSILASAHGSQAGDATFTRLADLNCDQRIGDADVQILKLGWALDAERTGKEALGE